MVLLAEVDEADEEEEEEEGVEVDVNVVTDTLLVVLAEVEAELEDTRVVEIGMVVDRMVVFSIEPVMLRAKYDQSQVRRLIEISPLGKKKPTGTPDRSDLNRPHRALRRRSGSDHRTRPRNRRSSHHSDRRRRPRLRHNDGSAPRQGRRSGRPGGSDPGYGEEGFDCACHLVWFWFVGWESGGCGILGECAIWGRKGPFVPV